MALEDTTVSRMCHRFGKIRRPQPRFEAVPSPRLNLRATIRQPMYQWWHGYGAVRHLFENPSIALVLGTLGSGRWGIRLPAGYRHPCQSPLACVHGIG